MFRSRTPSFRRATRAVRRATAGLAGMTDRGLTDRAVAAREAAAGPGRAAGRKPDVRGFLPLVDEAVYRTHGFRLHDVQLWAVLAACDNAVVEMQTGEGKTVVTGAIAACQSVVHPAVHVGTTNAYLAERDMAEMRPVFERLGLSVGLLPEGNDPAATRAAYASDITYGPGYQYGFDYLRDQVQLRERRPSRLGRRLAARIGGTDLNAGLVHPAEHHVALIDEADSVMIDEAITPLVISGGRAGSEDPTPFRIARDLAAGLTEGDDYRIVMPQRSVEIQPGAMERCHAAIAEIKSLRLARPWERYIRNAVRAERLLRRDVDYVVSEDKIQIVDQNTGRIFSDRTWQDGLHQAVEAAEGVAVCPSDAAVARVTRQRYLRLYSRLGGLTGTASGVEREFASVYGTRVFAVPPNRPCIRRLFRPRFFRDQGAKLAAVAADVRSRSAAGQPVLVGTRTIAESRAVEEAVRALGTEAVVLNGVQDRSEADIIAEAGRPGAVTIATNMAGRGTDIKLDDRAIRAGGLHVVGCGPNALARIDRQLVGRSARQGDPGSAQFFVAADDDVIRDHAARLSGRIAAASARTGESRKDFAGHVRELQSRLEERRREQREQMVRGDRWMDTVRAAIETE